jgi:hypothetical protein
MSERGTWPFFSVEVVVTIDWNRYNGEESGRHYIYPNIIRCFVDGAMSAGDVYRLGT